MIDECLQLEELDIADKAIFTSKTAPAALSRYLYYPDHLVRMPHPAFGIGDTLWKLWNEPAFESLLGAILGEPFRNLRDDNIRDESIASFLSRRFSQKVVDRLVSGVIHGIYAGDVHQLSAKSLLPVFWRDEGEEGAILTGALRSGAEGQPMTKLDDEFFEHMRKNLPAPRLRHLAERSSVYTFPNGSQTLADALANRLMESGRVTFEMNSPVQSIVPTSGSSITMFCNNRPVQHSHLISSLPPAQLESICCARTAKEGVSPTTVIPHIPTVTVMTVNLYYRTPGLHPPGFGYLIPQATPFDQNPERALGVVFDDAVAPDPANMADDAFRQLDPSWNQADSSLAPDDLRIRSSLKNDPQDEVTARGTKLTVMLGGHWWDDWTSYPDEQEGLALARSLLERHLGIKEEPEAWRVNLQRDCIPQYVVGHEDKLKTARANLAQHYGGRLRVTGNWVSGVGVNDCIRSAWHVARSLQDWRGTGLEHVGEPYIFRIKAVPTKPS